ncbi:uncharacterized protein LOC128171000 [Crassostrea angulata]|uniref:uncharacterized protein LOC128171000 n=1 Tax=Magallana angulata TaxID=2784310 RepID=UPI0022B1E2D7|nr:uncharacterized protein LOC128171000 [Crassostrea angulata]
MNPYQNLSFSQLDFSYNANGSGCVQNMSNVVYHVPPSVTKTCDFNCVCCLRLKVGQDPPCSISKVSVGTQTMLETPQGLDPSGFWTRGTYEHTVLQKSVNSVVTKYSLTGKKDSNWEAATTEVMTSFSCDMPQTPTIRQKIQARMKKAIYWMRFYTKKEKEAQKSGISVRSFLSRKRKINKSKDGEPAGLLEEEHETGADNRDDAEAVPPHHEETDSDSSDSDTPLALYAQKMKKI